MKLTVEDLIELADMDTCNEGGVFDYIEFGSIVQDTVLGIDLEETSFQTEKSKEMKGKTLSDEDIMKLAIQGGFYDCLIDWLSIPSREDENNLKVDLIRLCRAVIKKAGKK